MRPPPSPACSSGRRCLIRTSQCTICCSSVAAACIRLNEVAANQWQVALKFLSPHSIVHYVTRSPSGKLLAHKERVNGVVGSHGAKCSAWVFGLHSHDDSDHVRHIWFWFSALFISHDVERCRRLSVHIMLHSIILQYKIKHKTQYHLQILN